MELDPQRHNPLYVRFTDFYVQWTKSPRIVLTVGKQGAPFTLDGANSSRELLTIDRSNLANNMWFPMEYLPGVSLSGRRAAWVYRVGLYSSGAANREFGEFNGGTATLGVIGYDFAPKLKVKEALLSGNYVYQTADRNNTFTRPFDHIGSINFRFEEGKWGARTDFTMGSGYLGQSNMWAILAMPFFNVTNKLQAVGRYTYIDSADPNGVRLATYESRVVTGRGDEYNEAYLGANYYFYGHRLKLQTGIQFVDMNDRANDGGASQACRGRPGFVSAGRKRTTFWRRIMRNLMAIVAALALTAACGGGSSGPVKAPGEAAARRAPRSTARARRSRFRSIRSGSPNTTNCIRTSRSTISRSGPAAAYGSCLAERCSLAPAINR